MDTANMDTIAARVRLMDGTIISGDLELLDYVEGHPTVSVVNATVEGLEKEQLEVNHHNIAWVDYI